jgi:hypothetical protein
VIQIKLIKVDQHPANITKNKLQHRFPMEVSQEPNPNTHFLDSSCLLFVSFPAPEDSDRNN